MAISARRPLRLLGIVLSIAAGACSSESSGAPSIDGGERVDAAHGSGGRGSGGTATSSGGASNGGTTGGAPPAAGGRETGGASTGGRSRQDTSPGDRECDPAAPLPQGAPLLEEGVWVSITPPGVKRGSAETCLGQGIAIDRCHPGTVYWSFGSFSEPGGIYKSTDAGATWRLLEGVDQPLHVRVDPRDSLHLYAGDGVRGGTMGFWVSSDGGETWKKPAGFTALEERERIFASDVYDVAVDPAEFDHVLVTSHSPWAWDSPEYGRASGVLESTDGGSSWKKVPLRTSWGAGHSIAFLSAPELGIGDSRTWLLGTQGDGLWRTTDGGASWNKVEETSIFHGGNHVYYSKSGVLYSGSGANVLRSTDNGATFTRVGPGDGYTAVFGDGTTLYTAAAYGRNAQPYITSPEADGTTWTPFEGGTQKWADGGPFEMALDAEHGILYSSNWMQGLWALKL